MTRHRSEAINYYAVFSSYFRLETFGNQLERIKIATVFHVKVSELQVLFKGILTRNHLKNKLVILNDSEGPP